MASLVVSPNFAARATAGQFNPQAEGGAHSYALRILGDQVQLGVLFDHRDDVAPHFLGQHRQLDVLVVLETVADDRGLVRGHGHHGHQFGFGADFEPEMIGPPVLQNFLHDLALLVDLDGINTEISTLITVFGDRGLKSGIDLAQPVLENVGEADQDGQRNTA